MEPLLRVERLTTVFDLPGGALPAVNDVTFEIQPGETLGLVGESGSGKSVTALSIMRLVQPPGRIAGGRIVFKGQDLLTLDERRMREVRGAGISLIFQEPMTALNPVFSVGDQVAEALIVHGRASRPESRIANRRLSPPALRRPASARNDCHRARVPSVARHRGRADDGAGRDDTGADPGSAPRHEVAVQPGAAADYARPRRCR